MNRYDYEIGLNFWKDFDKSEITTDKIKELFQHYENPNYFLWARSKEYYEKNIELIDTKKYTTPLDNLYLRTVILPLLPDNGRTSIPPSEVDTNWKNPDWWYENFRALLRILENMYVKKSVKESFKQNKYLPKGPYHSWLTRAVQFIDTQRSEFYLPTVISALRLDKAAHDGMHEGKPTEAECKPDFLLDDGREAELKVCSMRYLQIYKEKLRTDYFNTLHNDFHDADGAFFITKTKPLKIYSVDLSTTIKALQFRDRTAEYDLSNLHLILVDDDGKLAREDWPAVPCAFLFGLKASWLE